MSVGFLKRSTIRQLAFQTLFAKNFEEKTQEVTDAHLMTLLEDEGFTDEEITSEDFNQREDIFYLHALLKATQDNQEAIDQLIEQHSHHWSINRILRADLTIMRLAIAEMQFLSREQVKDKAPTRVIIDEAIKLAKTYSDEKSSKFINGVLTNFVSL
ncbi:transcription antitermination factor NusB [Atopobacter sp. AH10]|uniref:transcription antitermination factor NusB n=1 Tax=Atopobacter sp. AH10 TaxID=2315861 RepID=UPI000EF236D1|nr:transcription antitermination factor NusB [Atopobacter sp. AH10]RLK62529.1 transcription antitermination factor NusB [Atopobacter sp. AH10]